MIFPIKHIERRYRLILAATQCLCAAGLWLALDRNVRGESPESSAPAAEAVSNAQISKWIEELDNDRYAIREQAQRQLQAAAPSALIEVTAAARKGSLESTTRALNILLAWSESSDSHLRNIALEQIAALPNRKTEALRAANILASAREQAAMEQIAALGGQFMADSQVQFAGVIAGHNQPTLRVIFNPSWKGGSDGLKHLANVRRATTISFYSAPIKEDALSHLTDLPNLRRIELYGTNIPQHAIDQFKNALPKQVTLDVRRGGALLGVNGFQAGPAKIRYVIPKGAAAKGGLLPGDIITQIGENNVASFEELTRRIADYQPGDSVDLEILRDGKKQIAKVTFDRWGINDPISQGKGGSKIFTPIPRPKR